MAGYPAPKPCQFHQNGDFNRATGQLVHEDLVLLRDECQTFNFDGLFTTADFDPVVSLLRDFSAPVQLNFEYIAMMIWRFDAI